MTAVMRAALEQAARELRRLADPAELAGFGDADAEHNDGLEIRARLARARLAAGDAEQALAGDDGAEDDTIPRRGAMTWQVNPLTTHDRDEWVPSVPLPLYGWRKRCGCGERFWTESAYRGHYALVHILGTP